MAPEEVDRAIAERHGKGVKLVKGENGAPDCIVIEDFGSVLDRAFEIQAENRKKRGPRKKRRSIP